MKKLLLISLFLLAFSTDAFARAYLRDCLIGGTSGCIDDLDITAVGDTDANNVNLAEGDIVVYGSISGTDTSWDFYIFDADGTDAEASPTIIRPDDYSTAGVWRRMDTRSVIDTDNDGDLTDETPSFDEVTANVFNGITIGDCSDGDNCTANEILANENITPVGGNWDLSNLTITWPSPWVITPDDTDPDISTQNAISLDNDGANETGDVVLREYDGSNQVALARKLNCIHATIPVPNDYADALRDKFPIWSNETGMTFTVTKIEAWADTDDTAFDVEEYDADGASNNATVDSVNCTTGTGPYTATETTISNASIEADHTVFIDFDDTDVPGWVKTSICGWYNADVD